MRFIVAFFLVAATAVRAAGTAIVLNNSTSTVYLWSVGSQVGTKQVLAPSGTYIETLRKDDKTGGIAIKVTKDEDGLYNGSGQQVFAYSLDGARVWYDISSVFGEPFKGTPLSVTSKTGGTINWPQGSNPGGTQVKVTSSDEALLFTINSPAAK